jgi:hypothetical protein
MRFLVVLVSAGAALALIAASGLMNWVFMTSLGKSEFEQQILGAVSVAVSAFLALLPTLMLWAYREGRRLFLLFGLPVFLAFAVFSLSSAIGFTAKNRGSLAEDRALATAKLFGVRHEIEETETRLKALGNPSSFPALQERLRGLEQERRWQSSKQCQDATTDASRRFCKGYFELKGEAAQAGEAQRLEDQLAVLRCENRQLEGQGAGREADNQAAVLARLLGLPAVKVERGLMFFLAVLVELGAALGLYFATGHMRPGSPAPKGRGRGLRIIDGAVLAPPSDPQPGRAPIKQIASAAPRRVPRMKQSRVQG